MLRIKINGYAKQPFILAPTLLNLGCLRLLYRLTPRLIWAAHLLYNVVYFVLLTVFVYSPDLLRRYPRQPDARPGARRHHLKRDAPPGRLRRRHPRPQRPGRARALKGYQVLRG